MRKLLSFTFILILSFSIKAQVMEQGASLINIGIGFATTFGDYGETKVPPVGFSYEYGVTEVISVGAFFDYTSSLSAQTQTHPVTGETIKYGFDYTIMLIGVVGNYHFPDLFNNDRVDTYAGVKLGYAKVDAKSFIEGSSSLPGGLILSANTGGSLFGGQAGIRYLFTDNIGAFVEAGYGTSAFKFGLTLKF